MTTRDFAIAGKIGGVDVTGLITTTIMAAELTLAMIPKLRLDPTIQFALSVQTMASLVALELATDDPRRVEMNLTSDLCKRYHSGDAESLLGVGPDHPLYRVVVWDFNPAASWIRVEIAHKNPPVPE